MTDLLPIIIDDEIAEIEREFKARAYVYPRLIASRKLSPVKASRQVAVLTATLERLKAVADNQGERRF